MATTWTQPIDSSELGQAQQQAVNALTDLARQGASDQADAILQDVTSSLDWTSIESNADLSDDGKRRALAVKYIALINTLARQLSIAAKAGSTQATDDAANVLGIAGLKGDVASLSISRRDASDRVADITDSVALQRLLERATRNGDEPLARAVADQALTLNDADTLNALTETRPELADAVARLWNAQQRKSPTLDTKTQWWLASLKPALLSNLQPYEIEAAAAGKANVGQWNV
jgi:hypothetical protein